MRTIIVTKIPDGGYLIAFPEDGQAGFAETVGAGSEQDLRITLVNRGLPEQVVVTVIADVQKNGQSVVPIYTRDPYPGRPFADAIRLLKERFPEGVLEYTPVGGNVFISLPLRDGGTFRAALTWQQAKYLAYSELSGDELKNSQFPSEWPR